MRCRVADRPGRTCPLETLTPYLVGAAIGVLSWVVFAVVNQPIGISTALSQASGAVAEAAVGEGPVRDWAWFAALTFIGALGFRLLERNQRAPVAATVRSDAADGPPSPTGTATTLPR